MTLHKPDHPELTVDALVSWLRWQPPDGEYVWSDPAFCLLGKYMADHDSSWGAVSYSELPNYELIAATKPWTFGAALERAEKLLALPAPDATTAMPPLPSLRPELELTAQEVPQEMQEVLASRLVFPREPEPAALPAPAASPKTEPNQL